VGASAHTAKEGIAAEAEGADYLGVGSFFSTRTKDDAVERGPGVFAEVQRAAGIACFAVGGISPANIEEAVSMGVRRAAAAAGISGADDPRDAASRLKAALVGARREEEGEGSQPLDSAGLA
jgi:thiamine-phosphate pyrophosphorylase